MTQNDQDSSQNAKLELGSRMRDARLAKKISLAEMARRLGYAKSHLSGVETGRNRPSRELVEGYERETDVGPGGLTSIIADLPPARHQPSAQRGASPNPMTTPNSDTQAGQASIFISHSHDDSHWCREFVRRLKQAGADVWYDEAHLGGGDWISVVEREIQRRPIFIVLLSPSAMASRWISMETDLAIVLQRTERNRMLLPVMIADADIRPFLRMFHYIDGRYLSPSDTAERVLDALRVMYATVPTPTPDDSQNDE
jgi:transcriptional regulator with XRE-family HTH domain